MVAAMLFSACGGSSTDEPATEPTLILEEPGGQADNEGTTLDPSPDGSDDALADEPTGQDEDIPVYDPCEGDDDATRSCLASWIGLPDEVGGEVCMADALMASLTRDEIAAMTLNPATGLEDHEVDAIVAAADACTDIAELLAISLGDGLTAECLTAQAETWVDNPLPGLLGALISANPDAAAFSNTDEIINACQGGTLPSPDDLNLVDEAGACIAQDQLVSAIQCIAQIPCTTAQLSLNYSPDEDNGKTLAEAHVEAMIICADFYKLFADKAADLEDSTGTPEEIRDCMLNTFSEVDLRDVLIAYANSFAEPNPEAEASLLNSFHDCYLPEGHSHSDPAAPAEVAGAAA